MKTVKKKKKKMLYFGIFSETWYRLKHRDVAFRSFFKFDLALQQIYLRMPGVKDVNFDKHLLHLFPKKLEYTFLGHPVY